MFLYLQKKKMYKSNIYIKLLNSPLWKMKRLNIIKRDKYKCSNCGAKESLIVHHKQYHFFKKRNMLALPWEYEDKYLVTLCKKCHEIGHKSFNIPTKQVLTK